MPDEGNYHQDDRISKWHCDVPNRSNCVPLEVTVKLRLIPAQDPGVPQSVGGLVRQSHQLMKP